MNTTLSTLPSRNVQFVRVMFNTFEESGVCWLVDVWLTRMTQYCENSRRVGMGLCHVGNRWTSELENVTDS